MARQLLGLLGMSVDPQHQDDASASLSAAAHNVSRRPKANSPREVFHRFAHYVATAAASPYAFFIAVLAVIIWAITGRMFKYSDTWQLWINTGTTIVTFLMVFLIQNTQNRDGKAIHLKLDELIRTKKGARNTLVNLENCTDEELEHIEREFKRLQARANLKQNGQRPQESRERAHRA